MTNELTKQNNQELINRANQNAGVSQKQNFPSFPLLTVNNIEKEEEINGEIVIKPAKKGFNISIRENGESVMDYFRENIEAVILKTRYAIRSKNKVTPEYYSFEFGAFDEVFKIRNKNKEIIFEGTYYEACKQFETGEKNSLGKPKKSFDLIFYLYINLDNEIYRLQLKPSSVGSYIEYQNSFGFNDSIVAYKTKFNLKKEESGKVRFYRIEFEKGESVNLEEQIKLQNELNKFFVISTAIKEKKVFGQETVIENDPVKTLIGEFGGKVIEDEDEINVEQIPF